MSEINYSYKVEAYALMTNADSSLLLLNPFLEKFGYQFILVNLQELETSFSDLVGLRKPYDTRGMVQVEKTGYSISNQFYEAIQHNLVFGLNLIFQKYLILLKSIDGYDQAVVNNTFSTGASVRSLNDMRKFLETFIPQIRLLKNCSIAYVLMFHIASDTRNITTRFGRGIIKTVSYASLNLNTAEIQKFISGYKQALIINHLSKLAFDLFNLCHDLTDTQLEFVTLISGKLSRNRSNIFNRFVNDQWQQAAQFKCYKPTKQ